MSQSNLMKFLRGTYWFFTGQSQWAPNWLCQLPSFFSPIYQGRQKFKWLGITIPADSAAGDTLFMHWRREFYCILQSVMMTMYKGRTT